MFGDRGKQQKIILKDKYQISDGELKQINKAGEKMILGFSKWYKYLNMESLFKAENEVAVLEKYHRDRKEFGQSHPDATFWTKVTSGEIFAEEPSTKTKNAIVKCMAKMDDLLAAFHFQCDAHALNRLETLQDHLTLSETTIGAHEAERAADAFRAYQHAKNSTKFR